MRLSINIEKRYAFAIIGAILLLAVAIGVYAYTASPGTIPNPGHTLTSVQGLFSDTNLQTTLTTKFCQTDGTNCPSGVSCHLNCSKTGQYFTTPPLIGAACKSTAFGGVIIDYLFVARTNQYTTDKYYETCCKVDC